jgi:hypothetical protein
MFVLEEIATSLLCLDIWDPQLPESQLLVAPQLPVQFTIRRSKKEMHSREV